MLRESITKIENFRVNAVVLFLYFFLLCSLREFLEQALLARHYDLLTYVHHCFFYGVSLLAGILIVSLLARTEPGKSSRIVAAGAWLIVLPPLIDRFVFFRQAMYEYLEPREFLYHFFTFCLNTWKAGTGTRIEISAILILAFVYVLIKRRSLAPALWAVYFLYILVLLGATPRLYLPLPSIYQPLQWLNRALLYTSFNFLLLVVLGLLFLWRVNRKLPAALLRELLSFRTAHFMLMVLLGVLIRGRLSFFVFPDYVYILFGLALIILLWLSTVLLNHVYDLEIDRISNPRRPLVLAKVSVAQYGNLSFILAIVSLLPALLLGLNCLLVALLIFLSSLAYSLTPLRLRRTMFSTLFVGWGSLLAFLLGYWLRAPGFRPVVDSRSLTVGLIVFLALSIGPLTKDLKDYSGDRANAIRTLFTVFGLARGKRLVSPLLALSLLTPLLLFHRPQDILFLLPVALAVAYFFYRRGYLPICFAGYGLVLVYSVARWLSWI